MLASRARRVAVYLTDVNGSTPKQLSPGGFRGEPIAPDGQSFINYQNRSAVVRSISDGSSKSIPGIQDGEDPIGWADSKHIFVQSQDRYRAEHL